MDGENNGKPYFLMDDLGEKPTILGNPHIPIDLSISHRIRYFSTENPPHKAHHSHGA